MDLGLSGKIALVTGSTAGIGLAAATGLAREQARVIINGRTEERVRAGIEQVKAAVPEANVEGIAADVSTAEGANKILAAYPQVDVLVNNAGLFTPGELATMTDDEWIATFNMNVLSGIRLARHYLPAMLKGNNGRVIFVSSESAVQVAPDAVHYGTTKAAVLALARGLAELTKGTNVTVNSVLPGPTASEAFGGAMQHIAGARGISVEELEREFFQFARPSSLISRFATTDEVANLIVYLCGAGASATNGASVRVEGGIIRSIV